MENSRPFRSRRPTALATVWRTRRRATTPSAWGLVAANFWFRLAARRARCSRSTGPTPQRASAAASSRSKLKPPSSRSSRRRGSAVREFIFDVQGHFVDPTGAWVKTAPADAFTWSPKAGCGLAAKPGPLSYLNCLGPEEFVKDVFLDSDTDMM